MADYLIVSVHPVGADGPKVLDHVEDVDSLASALEKSTHQLAPSEQVDVYRVFSGPRRIQIVETVTRAIEDVV
tara:strand:- start:733 stop:951 length:219 start_codon:yes stop_codon:yes gene_type:complete